MTAQDGAVLVVVGTGAGRALPATVHLLGPGATVRQVPVSDRTAGDGGASPEALTLALARHGVALDVSAYLPGATDTPQDAPAAGQSLPARQVPAWAWDCPSWCTDCTTGPRLGYDHDHARAYLAHGTPVGQVGPWQVRLAQHTLLAPAPVVGRTGVQLRRTSTTAGDLMAPADAAFLAQLLGTAHELAAGALAPRTAPLDPHARHEPQDGPR